MPKKIKTPQKGRPNWNNADAAAEIVQQINALSATIIEPRTMGEIKFTGEGYVIDLSRLGEYIESKISIMISDYLSNNLGIRAECNDDGTLSVSLYQKGY